VGKRLRAESSSDGPRAVFGLDVILASATEAYLVRDQILAAKVFTVR
jgi:hypothetical protein